MITIFGCDREPVFLDLIEDTLDDISYEKEIMYSFCRFSSTEEMVGRFEDKLNIPSLVFLDVKNNRIEARNAADTLHRLYPDCRLITMTEDDDDVFLTFDFKADMSITKRNLSTNARDYLEHILPQLKSSEKTTINLQIYCSDRTYEECCFRLSDIVFLECVMRKYYLTLRDGSCYRIKCTMWRDLMQKFCMMPFAVPHNNYVVNMDYITRLTTDALTVSPFGKRISLSKYRKKYFTELYNANKPVVLEEGV